MQHSIHTPPHDRSSKDSAAKEGGNVRVSVIGSSFRLTKHPKTDNGKPSHRSQHLCIVYDESGKDVTPQPLEKKGLIDTRKTPSALLSQMETTPIDFQSMSEKGRTKLMMSCIPSSISMESLIEEDDFPGGIVGLTGSISVTRVEDQVHPDAPPPNAAQDALFTVILAETPTVIHFDQISLQVQIATDDGDAIEHQNDVYKKLCIKKETSDAYSGRWAQTFNYPQKTKAIQTVLVGMQDIGLTTTDWKIYDCYKEIRTEENHELEMSGVDSEEEFSENDVPLLDQSTDTASVQGTDHQWITEAKYPVDTKPSITQQAEVESMLGTKHTSTSVISVSKGSTTVPVETQVEQSTPVQQRQQSKLVLPPAIKPENMKKTLFHLDRALSTNLYQKQLSAYRGQEVVEEPIEYTQQAVSEMEESEDDEDFGQGFLKMSRFGVHSPKSERVLEVSLPPSVPESKFGIAVLWSFHTPKLQDCSVTSLEWNPGNPDILGVGYGDLDYSSTRPGFAACWSLKNVLYPERLYETVFGVSAVSFAKHNPGLMSVAMQDGTIFIYNIHHKVNDVIVDTASHAEHLTGCIWQMMWVERPQGGRTKEEKEVLVSVSEDGRITQWSFSKGIEAILLMRVKRKPLERTKQWKQSESLVARFSVPYSIDFHPNNSSLYIVGTGEGDVNECSLSHSDQFICTYSSHIGPVYAVGFSPFVHNIFASCSADWSMKLWYHEQRTCLLTVSSHQSAIMDMCWSPLSSTVIACIHPTCVEVWDLSVSVLDPVSTFIPQGDATQTVVNFAPSGQSILVGDSSGKVTMYQIKNVPPPHENQKEALWDLVRASITNKATVEDAEANY